MGYRGILIKNLFLGVLPLQGIYVRERIGGKEEMELVIAILGVLVAIMGLITASAQYRGEKNKTKKGM